MPVDSVVKAVVEFSVTINTSQYTLLCSTSDAKHLNVCTLIFVVNGFYFTIRLDVYAL